MVAPLPGVDGFLLERRAKPPEIDTPTQASPNADVICYAAGRGRRARTLTEDQAPGRPTMLRAGRAAEGRPKRRRPPGAAREGARRPHAPAARGRASQACRRGLRVRAPAAVRHQAVDALGAPEETARRGHRRRRAPGPLGLLLRHPRVAGGAVHMAEVTTPEPNIRETVRERYAAAARAASTGEGSSCGCGPVSLTDQREEVVFGGSLYSDGETEGATETAVGASLGCGVPTAVADLHP